MESGTLNSYNPVPYVLQFFATYGWYMVGSSMAAVYGYLKLKPILHQWKVSRDDAAYHQDPDIVLARIEAIQRARELQQLKLMQASERALEEQKEREERKRQETAERLEKYGSAAGGQRLGSEDGDYLPLSGGASTSSYKPPKRSKCGGGGCGK